MSQTKTVDLLVVADQPGTIRAEMQYYLDPPVDRGENHVFIGTASSYRHKMDTHVVPINDMRGNEQFFTLDKQGFQFHKHKSVEKAFNDLDKVKTIIYPETAELLKKVTGATRVHAFSHTIRTQTYENGLAAAEGKDDLEPVNVVGPARRLHVDQSFDGAVRVLKDELPAEEARRLSKSRWAIVTVWRPIHRSIKRDPLAVCDARSVDVERDLVPVVGRYFIKETGRYEDVVETWGIRFAEGHKWWYCSEMTPDEVLMIKCFDSKTDGRARAVPHGAFELPGQAGPARESIEVRCLVFWEDDKDNQDTALPSML